MTLQNLLKSIELKGGGVLALVPLPQTTGKKQNENANIMVDQIVKRLFHFDNFDH